MDQRIAEGNRLEQEIKAELDSAPRKYRGRCDLQSQVRE
jgi:hypothetical protein